MNSSEIAIQNAKASAIKNQVEVNYICKSVFDLPIDVGTYDFMYDSGLLHHLAPHRRLTYIELINRMLKSGGYFGLVCFAWGEGVADEVDDWEFYEKRRVGVAFSEDKLRKLFAGAFEPIETRKMRDNVPDTLHGMDFLWTALFQKK